jgi:hypothetical protein
VQEMSGRMMTFCGLAMIAINNKPHLISDFDEIADSQDENKSVDEEKDNNKKSLEKIEKSLVSLLEEVSKIKNEKV